MRMAVTGGDPFPPCWSRPVTGVSRPGGCAGRPRSSGRRTPRSAPLGRWPAPRCGRSAAPARLGGRAGAGRAVGGLARLLPVDRPHLVQRPAASCRPHRRAARGPAMGRLRGSRPRRLGPATSARPGRAGERPPGRRATRPPAPVPARPGMADARTPKGPLRGSPPEGV